jgi:hypothetical protein
MKTNVVTLRAVRKVYQKVPFQLLPARYRNTYVTGQHIDPDKEETFGNLTLNQMLGTEPLTPEQRKVFPYVINPEETQMYVDRTEFNLEVPMDKARYDLLILYERASRTRKEYKKGTHYFYFEDKTKEAKVEINETDKWFEAVSKVKECGQEKIYDVAIYLNYLVPDINLTKNMPYDIIIAEIYKLCKSQPDKVIMSFDPRVTENVFILKLEGYGILTRKEGNFYDGARFLGKLEQVVDYMNKKDNSAIIDRWNQQLLERQGKIPQTQIVKDEETPESLKVMIKSKLFDEDYNGANKYYLKLMKYIPGANEETEKFYHQIVKGMDDLKGSKLNELRKEYEGKELEELYAIASNSKRKKTDWEGLDKLKMVEYLLSFVK